MAAHSEPNLETYYADGAISEGMAVGYGSDKDHVVQASANTQQCKGIAYGSASASGNRIVIAKPGGGAKGLLAETVVAGDGLVSHTNGKLVKPNASGDKIIARAEEGGSSDSLIAIRVIDTGALAAE